MQCYAECFIIITQLSIREGSILRNESAKPATFGELRKKWLPGGESENINYCIPVNIGVIAQDLQNVQFDQLRVDEAVKKIMKRLNKCFGKFKNENKKRSHNQLVVMTQYKNDLERYISDKLHKDYGAEIVSNVTNEEIKSSCWIAIAAWDGIVSDDSQVYTTVKNILSTDYSDIGDSQGYKLRFPENRPIYQIVMPLKNGAQEKIDYQVREIYPHLLETINSGTTWFDRRNYSKLRRKDAKRKNFEANARKVKRFNKKISNYDNKIDAQTKDVYDVLPWHHAKGVKLPICVEIANLREIYYDVISMKAQGMQKIQTYALMILAFLGLTFFSLYSDLSTGSDLFNHVFLAAYLIFMALAYMCYWFFVKRVNVHKDYLEFRALAEGMRVQCYWYAAGINESVGAHYNVKFQKDMLWAKQAFNAWYMMDFKKNNIDVGYQPDYLCIKTEWIGTLAVKGEKGYEIVPPDGCPTDTKGQYGFYVKSLKDDASKDSLSSAITAALTVISVISSFVLAGVLIFNEFAYENWLTFAISMMNIFTLTITYHDNIKAYKELAAKYSYCAMLAQKALQDYECDSDNVEKIKAIFKQFGVEALEENAEWLMIKNDREPEVMN